MLQNICPLTYFGHVKMKLVSMATHNAILKNGGVPTKSLICQLLLNLNTKFGTRLKLRHIPFIIWSAIQIIQLCKLSNLHIHEY